MSSMMQGAPPSPAATGAAQSGSYPSSNDPAAKLFAQACDLLQQGEQLEPDPAIKAQAAKLYAQCRQLAASPEQGHDAALGLSPQLKFIQRQAAMNAQQNGQGGQ